MVYFWLRYHDSFLTYLWHKVVNVYKSFRTECNFFEKSEKLLTSRATQFFSTYYLSFLSFSPTKCQIQLQNQNQKAKWILTVILESIRTNLYVDLGWRFSTSSSELRLSLFIYLDQRFLALLSVCLSQSYCYYH